jgi:hypothetical protein
MMMEGRMDEETKPKGIRNREDGNVEARAYPEVEI